MLTDSDISALRLDFANDRFDLTSTAYRQLRARGLRVEDLARAVAAPTSALRDVSYRDDPRKGEHGLLVCPAVTPPLLVSLWYIREQPRSILVEDLT